MNVHVNFVVLLVLYLGSTHSVIDGHAVRVSNIVRHVHLVSHLFYRVTSSNRVKECNKFVLLFDVLWMRYPVLSQVSRTAISQILSELSVNATTRV